MIVLVFAYNHDQIKELRTLEHDRADAIGSEESSAARRMAAACHHLSLLFMLRHSDQACIMRST